MLNIVFFDVSVENLGVQILSAILKKNGYNCRVVFEISHHLNPLTGFDEAREREIVNEILSHDPDIVGFSSFTDTFQLCCQIARSLKDKKRGVTTIFGGYHPTIMQGDILKNDFIDFSFVGEAEKSLLDFLREYRSGRDYRKVNNLCYRRNGIAVCNDVGPYLKSHELDALPFPEKDIYLNRNPSAKLSYLILTGRGCNFACAYCSITSVRKIYHREKCHVRRRSPGNVIDELVWAKGKYNFRFIRFIDDLFTVDREWLSDFSLLYNKHISVPSECSTHPVLIDGETARCLGRMNMKIVNLGVQTVDESYRREVLHRTGSNRQIEEAVNLLKKENIEVALNHILDLPNEHPDSIRESIIQYSRWNPSAVAAFKLTYYPKTDIIETAKQAGIIDDDTISDINEGKHASASASSENIHASLSVQNLRFAILIRSIGFLPGFVVRFLAGHLRLVIPSRLLFYLVSIYPRWKLQRHRKNTYQIFSIVMQQRIKELFADK